MRQIIVKYKKLGGIQLLISYVRSNLIITVLSQLCLLGVSQKALEILRLITQFKIQKRLSRKYNKIIKQNDCSKAVYESSNKVWICWLQGINNAPELVQKCYHSVINNLEDREVIVITSDNYKDYTDLPSFIIEKWVSGKITNTHFSDILRIELLYLHGGLWLDSTVYCTSKEVPSYILNSDFFVYQVLKPGLDGHAIKQSSWLMSAKKGNFIITKTRELLFEYWKKKNRLVDYFLLHHFISIILEKYPKEHRKIPKVSNSHPHILLLQLFEEFDNNQFEHIKSLTTFHKLSYKFSDEKLFKQETFYDFIVRAR